MESSRVQGGEANTPNVGEEVNHSCVLLSLIQLLVASYRYTTIVAT